MWKNAHTKSLLPYCSYEGQALASFAKPLQQSLYASTINENKFYINMTIENNFPKISKRNAGFSGVKKAIKLLM